ncbi:MAG: ABC transporter permease [candidate division WOR-3 bacterium]|nr:ABC transporter permease [candidate division WOR-3 bacterium]
MRAILVLVRKEIKELLTTALLVPIVVMVLFFAFIGRMMTREYKKSTTPKPILVADFDQSATSNYIINILKQQNLIINQSIGNIDFLLKQAQQTNINVVLILPESLELKYNSLQHPQISIYTLINSLSPFSDIGVAQVKSAMNIVNESLGVRIIRQYNKDAPIATIKRPLNITDYVNLKNQTFLANPIQIKNTIRVQNVFIPVILLMVIIYISQMIAAAMGQEKENKTLETLLTFPISRLQILIGKMLGAGIVAILLSGVFLLGIKFYLTPMSRINTPTASAIKTMVNIGPSQTTLYLVLATSLFLAIICAASLATLLSIFATDAKQAQVVITPINLLVIFPYFITILLDINSISVVLKIILYMIPFTYPFIIPQALFFNQTSLIIGGFAYMIIFAVIITIIAAKLFSSDLILTAKLKIRR